MQKEGRSLLGRRSIKIRQVPSMLAIETILASVTSPGSRSGNRVQGILISRGVQHLEKVYLSPRKAMEVRCIIPKIIVLSVAVLTVECEDRGH